MRKTLLVPLIALGAAGALAPSAASAQRFSLYVGSGYPYNYQPYYPRYRYVDPYEYDEGNAWRRHERWEARRRWERHERWEREARRRHWREEYREHRRWHRDDDDDD